jgi:hypothetical protein
MPSDTCSQNKKSHVIDQRFILNDTHNIQAINYT